MREIDPEVLKTYDEEADYINRSSKKFAPRVQVKEGSAWLLRFLPARLGPKKTFYARIARHWAGNFPYVCKKHTSELFGGDEKFQCPLCYVTDAVMQKHRERDDPLRNKAFRSSANVQWLTYVCVKFKDDEKPPKSERLTAHEMWLPKTSFNELLTSYKHGVKVSPLSFTDFEKGRDFLMIRSAKNKTTFERQDSGPIFNLSDPTLMKEWIDKLMTSILFEEPKFPSEKKLEEIADKLEEMLSSHRRYDEEGEDRPRRKPSYDMDEDEEEALPRHHSRDEEEEEEHPRHKPSRDEDEELRRKPARDEDEEDEPRKKPSREDDEEEPRRKPTRDEDEEDEPPSRKPAREDEPRRKPARDEDDDGDPPSASDSELPPPPAKKLKAPAVSTSSVDDEDEVADEEKESAPAKKPTAEDDGEDEPPPVSAPKKLSERIAKGIRSVNSR